MDLKEASMLLSKLSLRHQVWVATRCAMRAVPWIGFLQDNKQLFQLSLVSFRCALTSSLWCQVPGRSSALEQACAASSEHANKVLSGTLYEVDSALMSAVSVTRACGAAAEAVIERRADKSASERALGLSIYVVRDYGGSSFKAPLESFSADLAAIPQDDNGPPAWQGSTMPIRHKEGWERLKSKLETNEETWKFWVQWYLRFLNGEASQNELLIRVASKITNAQWVEGPETVADEIGRISAQFYLETRVSKLENRQQVEKAGRHGIGGNYPPEDMQIEPQIVRETTIIWAAVDELKAETEKESPDKSAVLRIIETLGRALRAILAWCAQKGDLSVDTLIKWGIPIGGAAVLANPKLLADVIEAAKAWVPFLP